MQSGDAVDRKHLAIALSRIPDPQEPQSIKEQVRTPGDLAADFLLHADAHGDLEGKRVVDLGAGTGVLGIGALLLGAKRVLAVEIDPHLVAIAQQAAATNRVQEDYRAITADVARLKEDQVVQELGAAPQTVIMNPPFGADRRSRAAGGDRVFLSMAFRLAPRVYSMHLADTQAFLAAYARDAGYSMEILATVDFPLPARFAHHRAQRIMKQVAIAGYTRTR